MIARLPLITPMRLGRAREPFDSSEYLFELKHDGFRALAYVEDGVCRLISRSHEFKGFNPLCDSILSSLGVKNAILDGELCCLGTDGASSTPRPSKPLYE